MKKIVDFTMDYDNEDIVELDFDEQNGYDADYLGISRVNGKDLLFARVRHEKNGAACGKIIALEIAYDENKNRVFYNADPASEYYWYDTQLNYGIDSKESHDLFKSGVSVNEVLNSLNIDHKKSPIKDKVESLVKISEEYSLPDDEDYSEIVEDYELVDDAMKTFNALSLNIYGLPFECLFKKCSSFNDINNNDKPYTKKKTISTR